MNFEAHCLETETQLGGRYEKVHRWLDEFAGTTEYGMRHRRVRHHLAGIEKVRRMWGDKAAEAARLHIVSDLKEEGWTGGDPFPRDEKDYVGMGLW